MKRNSNENVKMTVFWVAAPYSPFRGACSLHHQGPYVSDSTSETSVNFYQTTRRNIPKEATFTLAVVRTSDLTSGKGNVAVDTGADAGDR
jgi:hypothetical protein